MTMLLTIKKSSNVVIFALFFVIVGCRSEKRNASYQNTFKQVEESFSADSAYSFCAIQCDFGPRILNSEAHEKCGKWIVDKFKSYGLSVIEQKTKIKTWDSEVLNATNIIASYKPDTTARILICAHWDTRPWADNDPDSTNWHKPIDGANDGASGVAIMLELARLITASEKVKMGIDFICFDAEDRGIPQWEEDNYDGNSWALGAQYWANNPHKSNYNARYGILLDMVGGKNARFYKEGVSMDYAPDVVKNVWNAATIAGYTDRFPNQRGGYVNDDHVPINTVLQIPTVDIIPYHDDARSSFGSTWHTLDDNMNNIDRTTLHAVGQTLTQLVFQE